MGIIQAGHWLPAIDGVTLTDDPYNLIAAKNYNKVPVIVGGNRDEEYEATAWGLNVPQNLTEEEFDATATEPGSYLNFTPEFLAEVKRHYDPEVYPYPAHLGNYSVWYWMYVRYLTDKIPEKGGCGPQWFAGLLDAGGSPAVYLYLFNHPPSFVPIAGGEGVFSMHTAEVAFVFGAMHQHASEAELSQTMSRYWYSVATSTDDVPGGAVSWPQFTTESHYFLVLDVESAGGIRTEQKLARHKACEWQFEQAQARGGPGFSPHGAPPNTNPFSEAPKRRLLLV